MSTSFKWARPINHTISITLLLSCFMFAWMRCTLDVLINAHMICSHDMFTWIAALLTQLWLLRPVNAVKMAGIHLKVMPLLLIAKWFWLNYRHFKWLIKPLYRPIPTSDEACVFAHASVSLWQVCLNGHSSIRKGPMVSRGERSALTSAPARGVLGQHFPSQQGTKCKRNLICVK